MLPKRTEVATYLGDGLYADTDGFGVVITSENGIDVLDRVVLEPEVIESFERFVEKLRGMKMLPPRRGS